MIQKIIEELPDILKQHICSMKKVSLDGTNNINMCDSQIKVINFDKVPNEYSRGKGWPNVPASNDALYINDDKKWYFIEFKNGKVNKADIFRKLYDSLIMLIELGIIPGFQFVRENVIYILVNNSEKVPKIQQTESLNMTYSYFYHLAQTEERLFELEKLERYLFKETHTYTKELFDNNFIRNMEERERLATN